MAAQKGKDLLLKVDTTGTASFSRSRACARVRSPSTPRPSTSPTPSRSALAGASRRRRRQDRARHRQGIFKDASTDETVRHYFFDGTVRTLAGRRPGFRHGRGAVPDRQPRIRRQPRRRGQFRADARLGRRAHLRGRVVRRATTMANRHRGEIEAVSTANATRCALRSARSPSSSMPLARTISAPSPSVSRPGACGARWILILTAGLRAAG